MSNDRIGFIGLGDMGYPMARRLLKHGFAVISCANRRREVIETLKRDGLIEKDNLRTVAAIADILITIVVDEIQTDDGTRQSTWSAVRARSIASTSPPPMRANVPFSAPMVPSLTGQSKH